jgi:ribosomal protein L40E
VRRAARAPDAQSARQRLFSRASGPVSPCFFLREQGGRSGARIKTVCCPESEGGRSDSRVYAIAIFFGQRTLSGASQTRDPQQNQHSSDMSPAPSVQCLFCHSRNPLGANYCERCDEQLDLQPCNRCGAVDHRTATACHKCGGPFSVPVVPGFAPLFKPTVKPAVKSAVTPAVKSAVVDEQLTHHASSDTRVANFKAEHLDALTHSRPVELPVDDVRLPEPPGAVAKLRRGTLVAVSSIFLVLIATAVSLYLYGGRAAQPVQPVQTQVQTQDVVGVSTAGKPEDAARSNGEAEVDKPSKPLDRTATHSGRTNKASAAPSFTPPAVDAATTASPLPAPDAEIKNAQNPSVAIRCEPAVATLGLCNLDSQTEQP